MKKASDFASADMRMFAQVFGDGVLDLALACCQKSGLPTVDDAGAYPQMGATCDGFSRAVILTAAPAYSDCFVF